MWQPCWFYKKQNGTMKLLDTNLWLALSLSGHSHHLAARKWFDEQTDSGSIAFCRATQQSFLRLMTTEGVLSVYGNKPLSNAEAWAGYEALMADDRVIFCPEPSGLDAIWKKLAARRSSSPKLWMDAYLAAFAITRDADLITIDKAFSQFPGLGVLVIEKIA